MTSYAVYKIDTTEHNTPEKIAQELRKPPHEWHDRLRDAEQKHGAKFHRERVGFSASVENFYIVAFKIEIARR